MTYPTTLKIRMKKLGILIKDARLCTGKNVVDCARIIGVSPDRIEAYEKGVTSPSLPELEILAYYFDIPLPHFWGKHSLSINQPGQNDPINLPRLVPLRTRIVGVLLRKARIDTGLSTRELAERTNIPEDEIDSFESGKTPVPLPHLEKIAKSLEMNIDDFFDKDGIVGKWSKQKKAIQEFISLPSDLQLFVTQPVNKPYLEIAKRLSEMSVDQLRGLAEGLLDITF